MKLNYKEKPSGFTGRNQIKVISWWEKEFCCSKMESVWGELIGVDESGLLADKKAVSLHWKEVYEDDVDHCYYPIKYCPFCGNEIVYSRE